MPLSRIRALSSVRRHHAAGIALIVANDARVLWRGSGYRLHLRTAGLRTISAASGRLSPARRWCALRGPAAAQSLSRFCAEGACVFAPAARCSLNLALVASCVNVPSIVSPLNWPSSVDRGKSHLQIDAHTSAVNGSPTSRRKPALWFQGIAPFHASSNRGDRNPPGSKSLCWASKRCLPNVRRNCSCAWRRAGKRKIETRLASSTILRKTWSE